MAEPGLCLQSKVICYLKAQSGRLGHTSNAELLVMTCLSPQTYHRHPQSQVKGTVCLTVQNIQGMQLGSRNPAMAMMQKLQDMVSNTPQAKT